MPKQVVTSAEVVNLASFSQCIRSGDTLYISGQVAWDKDGNVIGQGDAAAQARRCFEGMKALVEAAGGTMDDIVKITMYLVNMADLPNVRAAREAVFRAPLPAWTTVGVTALVRPELLVEIEAIAVLR